MGGLPLERNDALRVDDWWLNSVPPADSFYWVQVRVAAANLGIAPLESTVDAGEVEYLIHMKRGLTIYGGSISPEQTAIRYALVRLP